MKYLRSIGCNLLDFHDNQTSPFSEAIPGIDRYITDTDTYDHFTY